MSERTAKIDIRLSPEEKEALIRAAKKAERGLSDFARRRLLRGLEIEEPEKGQC